MKKTRICILLAVLPTVVLAARKHRESVYQRAWCSREKGQIEKVLPDKTRVDCLTAEYAIEFDFADKWAEAVGQSLFYAAQTGKKPGIVLIMEKTNGERFYRRLKAATNNLNIKIWVMNNLKD